MNAKVIKPIAVQPPENVEIVLTKEQARVLATILFSICWDDDTAGDVASDLYQSLADAGVYRKPYSVAQRQGGFTVLLGGDDE